MKEVFCEREGSCERASRFFFFEVYCFFKLRLRRSGYGVKEAEEWREPAIYVAVVEVRREARGEAEKMA